MNVLRPVVAVLAVLVRVVASEVFLQVAGLGLLVAASSVAFGVVGGLAAAGAALVLVGVAVERGNG